MNRTTIPTVFGLAMLCLVGAGTLAVAASPVASAPAIAAEPSAVGPQWADEGRGRVGPRGHAHGRVADGPVRSAARQLRMLERLYRINGRGNEIPALYKDVLTRTQNPQLRTFAYGRLAHAELQPAHPELAIESLRKSVDESLKRVH
ncbi:MAG: hypothetical protein ABI411_08330 [Tahibacter sp.]